MTQAVYKLAESQSLDVPIASSPASVIVLRSHQELLSYDQKLAALSANAIEPNIFYEPWMLLPALEAYSANRKLFLVLVFVTVISNNVKRSVLSGFFPMEKRHFYRGLPISCLTLWRSPYSFLSTPLVHKNHVYPACGAFIKWAKQNSALLLEMPQLSAEGAVNKALKSILQADNIKFTENRFDRAMFYRRTDADNYMAKSLSGKKRKELRRQKRRLSELGELSWEVLESENDLEFWVNEFIQLEASGWKGHKGTAFKSNILSKDYFRTITKQAFKRNRLMMLALRLNRRPIAMKCNFIENDGGYAFKIAFDEDFQHFSPGVLLEMENISRLHSNPGLRWMDSCAAPDNSMINHLWLDRKPMCTFLASTRHGISDYIVDLIPILRRFKADIFKWFSSKFKYSSPV